MQHKITTLDAQPSSPTVSSILVNVTGMLIVSALLSDIDARSDPVQVDDSQNPLQFSQVFQLVPDGGSYYVYVAPFLSFKLAPDRRVFELCRAASTTSSASTTARSRSRVGVGAAHTSSVCMYQESINT